MSIYTKNQNNNDNMSTSRHEHKKKTKKKKPKKKFIIMMFIIYEFLFMACTTPFVLLYGPFDNAKKKFVGSAMGSMHFQNLAKWFLSDEEIKVIIGGNDSDESEDDTTDIKSINISSINDDTIKRYTIDENSRYQGYYIVINDPKRVKIGLSSKLEVEGETTSEIAEHNGAIAAINGGAFVDKTTVDWTGTGAYPDGLVMSEGKVVWDSTSGEKTELFGITKKGVFIVGKYCLGELQKLGVQEALSFGPVLMVNGRKSKIEVDGGFAPRTAIGQRKDGAIIMLVLDGKNIKRFGATYTEVQEIMNKLGAVNAINLDGGKSTTMYYKGNIINSPTNSMGERTIPTAVIVK